MNVVILLGTLLAFFHESTGRRTVGRKACYNGKGEVTECINIMQCQPLLDLLHSGRNNRTILSYLRRETCGYDNEDPTVCCPSEERIFHASSDYSSLPSPPDCGKSIVTDLPRIVGGRLAKLGTWPWITALGFRSRTNPSPEWLCGGALINTRFIVTAAHCTLHPRLQMFIARMGDLDLNDNIVDGASPVDILIEKLIRHESYSTTKFTDDIALVKLVEDVHFTPLIQPICLPKTPELMTKNFYKYTPYVAGWGSTSFKGPQSSALREVQLPVQSNEECLEVYKTKNSFIIPSQLCAGYKEGEKDACQGDSGGPLMLPQGDSFYLIGVVSYGYKCAEPGFPGVFTRVTKYIQWISTNIQNS